jgi:cytoskeletal protein CcmA (bactofilin family)
MANQFKVKNGLVVDLGGANITGSSKITGSLNISDNLAVTGSGTFLGNLIVAGDITAQQIIISSSVTHFTESFSSGSTRFGDTNDDTHQFTGSVNITGSLTINGSSFTAATSGTSGSSGTAGSS